MKIISYTKIKGGVGSTTLVYNHADELASKGFKVITADFDFQCNLSQTYEIFNTENTVANIFTGGKVDIIPVKDNVSLISGDMQLDSVDANLINDDARNFHLKNWIEDNKELLKDFDYFLIDCRPDFSTITKNAVLVSDYLLSPITPSEFGYNAQFNLKTRLVNFKNKMVDFNTRQTLVKAKLYFIANMVSSTTNSSSDFLDAIRDNKEIIGAFPDYEIFNQTTMEKLSITDMSKLSSYRKQKKFFITYHETFDKIDSYLV